ncbi:MAG: hypothetical protein IKZ88_01845 [Neisseriaceae bacterium]|nr:hypothetical protein [Neisseriaceae bacterium]
MPTATPLGVDDTLFFKYFALWANGGLGSPPYNKALRLCGGLANPPYGFLPETVFCRCGGSKTHPTKLFNRRF